MFSDGKGNDMNSAYTLAGMTALLFLISVVCYRASNRGDILSGLNIVLFVLSLMLELCCLVPALMLLQHLPR
jgi:hypothetical protein